VTIANIALVLLVIRVVSIYFISRVISRQWKLFRYDDSDGLNSTRKVMFALSHGLLLGSILPIMVDVYFGIIHRVDSTDSPILTLYAISNAVTSLIASIILWAVYRNPLTEHDENK
jgi:type III secretory pathway component EscT